MKTASKYIAAYLLTLVVALELASRLPHPLGLWTLGAILVAYLALALYVLDMTLPWIQFFSPNLYRLPQTSPSDAVTLTFDDGPHPAVTPLVLDILDRYGAKACFFCIGSNVTRYPGIVQDILARGHVVGNHTQNHRILPFLSMSRAKREIEDGQKSLRDCGAPTPYFRFPKGYRSFFLHRLLQKLGLRSIGFSYPAYDVENPPASQIVETVLSKVKARDILLFHDGCAPGKLSERSSLVEALPMILDGIHKKGLRVISLPEALT